MNLRTSIYTKQKKPQLFSCDHSIFLFPTILKRWFQPFGLHPLLNESLRLQFPFVFRRLQSLQLPLSDSPLSSTFVSDFSRPSIPRLIAASFLLSDPRCFSILSSASVLDSGYSASVSSFPLSSWLRLTVASPVHPFCFRFLSFPRSFRPGFPCLLSWFFVLGFLYVSFRPSLIRSHSCSSGAYLMLSLSVFPLPIRFLSSASLPVPATQPLFFLSFSSRFRLTVASPVPASALASSVSPFSPA